MLDALFHRDPESIALELSNGRQVTVRALTDHLVQDVRSLQAAGHVELFLSAEPSLSNIYTILLAMALGASLTISSSADGGVDDTPGAILVRQVVTRRLALISEQQDRGELRSTNSRPLETLNEGGFRLCLETSGSTGRKKKVVISYAALNFQSEAVSRDLKIDSTSRQLLYMPLSYVYGFSVLTTWLRSGGQLLLTNRSTASFGPLFDELIARDVTLFSGVPFTYRMLKKWGLWKLASSRIDTLTQAGGRMELALKREILTTLPATALWVMYGQTEFGGRISQHRITLDTLHDTCVGAPLPGIEVHVEREPSEPEVGEIFVHSPSVCENIRELARAKTVDNKLFFSTGDVGNYEDGALYISGRNTSFVKLGGDRVSIQAIETLFYEAMGVEDCFVCLSSGRTEKLLIGIVTGAFEGLSEHWEVGTVLDRLGVGAGLRNILGSKPFELYALIGDVPRRSNGKADLTRIHERLQHAANEEETIHIRM